MIRFNAIADGNCLYYSLMFRLAVDWLNGDLKRDAKTTNQVAGLFLELDKTYPNLEIKAKLTDNITPKAIDEIFQTILGFCMDDSEKVNWETYQKLMGAAARNFTVNKIHDTESIQIDIKNKFRVALHRTVDTFDDFTESRHFVYPDALTGIVAIKNKINNAILTNKHKSALARASELIDWFENGTEGGKSGFDLWLDHIIEDKMFAGNLEFNVFTESLGVAGQYRTLGDRLGTFHLASEPEESIAGLSLKESYTLLLNFTRSAHWEVYLEKDAEGINQRIAIGDVSGSYQYNKSIIQASESGSSNDALRVDSTEQKVPLIFSSPVEPVDEAVCPFASDKAKSKKYGKLTDEKPLVIWIKQASQDVIDVLLKMDNKFFNLLVSATKPEGIFGVGEGSSRKPGLIDLSAANLERFFITKNMISAEANDNKKKSTISVY